MTAGILIGIALCLFTQGLFFLGRRVWRNNLPPVPTQPPRTGAQLANAAVYDDYVRYHPRLVSVRYTRRTRRGRARLNMEEDQDTFE